MALLTMSPPGMTKEIYAEIYDNLISQNAKEDGVSFNKMLDTMYENTIREDNAKIVKLSIDKVVNWLKLKESTFLNDLTKWKRLQSTFDHDESASKEFYWAMDTMSRDYICDKNIVGKNEEDRQIVAEFFNYQLL